MDSAGRSHVLNKPTPSLSDFNKLTRALLAMASNFFACAFNTRFLITISAEEKLVSVTNGSVVEGYRDRLSGWWIAIDKISIRSSGAGELILFSDRSINGSL